MRAAILIAAVALAACATSPDRPTSAPEIAITIDDLPVHGPIPTGQTPLDVAREMTAALEAGGVRTAYAFVNGRWTETAPETLEALELWRRAGVALGNHSWSHANVNALDPAAYEEEIARNEPLLESLMAGEDWRWFRYPYLAEGDDPAKRSAVRAILARRGYRIAAVTMDFSDWQWTAPYARCRSLGDEGAISELERLYLAAAKESAGFYRGLARSLYGRDIPYVLLMHTGAFDARMLPRLIALYRELGFRFVTLNEAESDPAYRDDVDPARPAGLQSLERRAVARGIPLAPRTDFAARLAAICPVRGAPDVSP
ncbi:MAG TPA: polysaccharide deacetylase family protein [Allosphingosinicella sp.]|jgi:peptidoglycan/xylan/chitin deacetylase (PgdA/CDA1 family)|nr:polysaccharide deacetylase family protein [Allosphingosinicella sp.]